ncbi:flavin reductase family protein [Nocardia sp. BMG111209]|uniref:flavin reductase family protein n=1 Tax=Nocardia sp. BMG111209 TaxID=1160137 RepID=UPI000380D707|nr:flavin reductase family protein [Nocardia sp. BMG111209]
MTVAAADFRRAMSRVPAPVTVATTVDRDGRPWGFTSSSFGSLSLSPPLVLVCLDHGASTHRAFTTTGHFLVNVLADGQSEIARRFATSGIDRFGAGDTEAAEFGLPGIPEAVVRVACSMYRIVDAGDHSILIGRAEATHVADRSPLVYVDRGFVLPGR